MYTDPYEILGVSRDATTDEIKKAYRSLSRKYHPDANVNNPNAAQAEEKFKAIQQAYQQIMNEKEHGTASSYGPGSSRGYYGQGTGYGKQEYDDWFGGYRNQQQSYSQNTADPHMQAAANYINSGHFKEALNVLNGMTSRSAQWYFFSAYANRGCGNTITALEHARKAVELDPSNFQYQALLNQLQSGGQWYSNMGGSYQSDSSAGRWCLNMLLLNMLCNCFCGGRFFCI